MPRRCPARAWSQACGYSAHDSTLRAQRRGPVRLTLPPHPEEEGERTGAQLPWSCVRRKIYRAREPRLQRRCCIDVYWLSVAGALSRGQWWAHTASRMARRGGDRMLHRFGSVWSANGPWGGRCGRQQVRQLADVSLGLEYDLVLVQLEAAADDGERCWCGRRCVPPVRGSASQ